MTKDTAPEKNPIGARVAERRKEIKMSQAKLAEHAGMTQTGIADIESGKVKRPTKLFEIATALQTTQDWLLNGSPARFRTVNAPTVNPRPKSNVSSLKQSHSRIGHLPNRELDNRQDVPEIDVRAGASYAGGFNQEENTIDEAGNSISADVTRAFWGIPISFLRDELRARPGQVHILPVRGDSMNDALFDGDRAIINLDDTDVSQGGIFALLDDNASVIIKQVELVRTPGNRRIKCTSRNPVYTPFELDLNEPVRIIGRVASKITRL